MALSARLEIRQGQGLVITPQLQQAIKLLQLSNLELEAYVETELEKNPLLQRDESEPDPQGDAEPADKAGGEVSTDQMSAGEAQADLDTRHDDVSPGERATGDVPEAAEAGGTIDWSRAGKGGGFDGESDGYESSLTAAKTLPEHLALARTGQLAHHGFLEMLLADEVTRRDRQVTCRAANKCRRPTTPTTSLTSPNSKRCRNPRARSTPRST